MASGVDFTSGRLGPGLWDLSRVLGGLERFFFFGPFSSLLQSEYLVGRARVEARDLSGLGFRVFERYQNHRGHKGGSWRGGLGAKMPITRPY